MRYRGHAIAMVVTLLATVGAMAEDLKGCDGRDPYRRIVPCTALIDAPDTAPSLRAQAFFMRGVAYAQLGQYQRAISDYDEAIRIDPRHPMVLNDRADAYLRIGKPAQGMPDADQALTIDPQDPLFNTTRGEIAQALGDRERAIHDHETALALGGVTFVRFYQCGLKLAQLYHGPLDGVMRPELLTALYECVDKGSHCDPVLVFPVLECPDPVG